MKIYGLLSKLPWPKSYLGKILLVAFVGIHVPLFALFAYLAWNTQLRPESWGVLAVVLAGTLTGVGATLYVIYGLLAPVRVASRALHNYREFGVVPGLPTGYGDKAGRLLSDVQHTIRDLDETIRSLDELAALDPLTGAYNRRIFQERLAEEVARAGRNGDVLTLAVLDVDGLKEINDHHGHAAGDACLKHLTDIIRRNIRDGDWFARWGGDEFAVVLWDGEGGRPRWAALERIAEDLGNNPVPLTDDEQVHLVFSAGVSRYGGEGNDPEQAAADLFARADGAVYRAKREGGGRIAYAR